MASESRWRLKKFVSRADNKLDNIGTWQIKRDERQASKCHKKALSLKAHANAFFLQGSEDNSFSIRSRITTI